MRRKSAKKKNPEETTLPSSRPFSTFYWIPAPATNYLPLRTTRQLMSTRKVAPFQSLFTFSHSMSGGALSAELLARLHAEHSGPKPPVVSALWTDITAAVTSMSNNNNKQTGPSSMSSALHPRTDRQKLRKFPLQHPKNRSDVKSAHLQPARGQRTWLEYQGSKGTGWMTSSLTFSPGLF